MVKFNVVVARLFKTYLAGVIIAPGNTHHDAGKDRSYTSPRFGGFRKFLCNKDYGTDVTKNVAFHLKYLERYFLRMIDGVKIVNTLLEK